MSFFAPWKTEIIFYEEAKNVLFRHLFEAETTTRNAIGRFKVDDKCNW